MELQGTLLHHIIMEIGLAQGTKTMMQGVMYTVHSTTEVPGGTRVASIQTLMASTILMDAQTVMVSDGTGGLLTAP